MNEGRVRGRLFYDPVPKPTEVAKWKWRKERERETERDRYELGWLVMLYFEQDRQEDGTAGSPASDWGYRLRRIRQKIEHHTAT